MVTATAWGLNWPVMKYLLVELEPLTLRTVSGFAASGAAFVIASRLGERVSVAPSQWLRLALYSLLNLTSWSGLVILALQWLPASEAAIISYTTPIWTALLAWALLGERPTWMRVIGLALGFAGVGLLMGGRPMAASVAQAPGVVLMLSATLLFSLGTVLSKARPLGLPPVATMAWQVGLGTVPIAVGALLAERFDLSTLTPGGWGCLIYLSFIAVCLAYICWFRALHLVPATTASMGVLLVPVIGVASSALALGEPLGLRQIAALVITLAGVSLAIRR
jgi:drug/metabolite transporter (DMT)-like permease